MKDFEDQIKKHLQDRGWDELRPADLAKSVMIEGAELLELFQWENKTLEEVKQDPEKLERIREELADVMIYCFDMASVLDIDVKEMLEAKLKKVQEKYPVELFNKERRAEEPGTESEYLRIKKEYREG